MIKREIAWIERLARQRVHGASERIEEMKRRSDERDDVAGIRILLRTMSLMTVQTERLIKDELWIANNRSDRRVESVALVRNAVVQLEQILGRGFEALVSPPERDFVALVQPYIRLARAVTDNPSTELIFESGEGFGYATWPNVFEEIEQGVVLLAPNLDRAVTALPPLGLVTYPARADHETLMHAVIAHEVAHLSVRRNVGLISDEFERGRPPGDLSDVGRLFEWTQELLCDMLAIRMIGPAFFFGLLEYLLPTHDPHDRWAAEIAQQDEDGEETHPPPAWRLRRLMREVAPFFHPRDNSYVAQGRGVYVSCQKLIPQPLPHTPGSKDAREQQFVESVLAELRKRLGDLAGGAAYPRGRFRRDVPLVWEKLDAAIAPAERVKHRRPRDANRPAESDVSRESDDLHENPPSTAWSEPMDWRSIMNGGYLRYLEHVLGNESAAEADAIRRETNSMVRGSIELSELHRRMIELSNQFDGLSVLQERQASPS